ncbi:MAG: putative 2OG-Fe(II) oxygenase [Pseudomonadota bacterium]
MTDIQVSPGFATPFVVRHHPDPTALNTELKALFLEREGDPRWAEKTPTLTLKVKLFESEFDVFKWPEPCVQQLKQFCFESLGKTLMQVNGCSPEDLSNLRIHNHAWFHVTRPGGYMGTHNHPMASWSGVYCVDTGGADADNADSGVIRFHDPRISVTMYMDAGNNHLLPPFEPGMRNYQFKPGQLVIFPSFLMHEVAPFTGDGTRITVAFNAWIKDSRAGG